MPQINKTDEQRLKWNAYNTKYSQRVYKNITLKLRKVEDQDVIEWLNNQPGSASELVRELVRKEIKRG